MTVMQVGPRAAANSGPASRTMSAPMTIDGNAVDIEAASSAAQVSATASVPASACVTDAAPVHVASVTSTDGGDTQSDTGRWVDVQEGDDGAAAPEVPVAAPQAVATQSSAFAVARCNGTDAEVVEDTPPTNGAGNDAAAGAMQQLDDADGGAAASAVASTEAVGAEASFMTSIPFDNKHVTSSDDPSFLARIAMQKVVATLRGNQLNQDPDGVPQSLQAAFDLQKSTLYRPVLMYLYGRRGKIRPDVRSLGDIAERLAWTEKAQGLRLEFNSGEGIEHAANMRSKMFERKRFLKQTYKTLRDAIAEVTGIFDAAVDISSKDVWTAAGMPIELYDAQVTVKHARAVAMRDYVVEILREELAPAISNVTEHLPAQRIAVRAFVTSAPVSSSTRPLLIRAVNTLLEVVPMARLRLARVLESLQMDRLAEGATPGQHMAVAAGAGAGAPGAVFFKTHVQFSDSIVKALAAYPNDPTAAKVLQRWSDQDWPRLCLEVKLAVRVQRIAQLQPSSAAASVAASLHQSGDAATVGARGSASIEAASMFPILREYNRPVSDNVPAAGAGDDLAADVGQPLLPAPSEGRVSSVTRHILALALKVLIDDDARATEDRKATSVCKAA